MDDRRLLPREVKALRRRLRRRVPLSKKELSDRMTKMIEQQKRDAIKDRHK